MSKNNSTLEVGDAVKICLENIDMKYESDSRWITQRMRNFNGMETTVSRVVRFGHQRAYELEGVTSKQGMPFTWCREALLKLKDISYKEKRIARISTGTFKEDSFIDLAGYAACGYEIATGNDAKVDDALMKATLSEYAPVEELAGYMGVRD